MAITPERRREVVQRLQHGNTSRLSADAALTLTLGLLTADEAGHVQADVAAAAAEDPQLVRLALSVLRTAQRGA